MKNVAQIVPISEAEARDPRPVAERRNPSDIGALSLAMRDRRTCNASTRIAKPLHSLLSV